nr:hypothetical protein [uncultured Desulfobulbus sp.]
MTTTNTKKKLMMAAILTSGLTLAISQAAMAQPSQGGGNSTKGAQVDMPCHYQMNGEYTKAREAFLQNTTAERKLLAQKKAEMQAIMKAGTPDTVKASAVAGELFEIREQLRLKALETGMPLSMLLMDSGQHGMSHKKYHTGGMNRQ